MVAAALANSIFSGWQDLDTRMDCDHLKTHMPRYFFNLTNDIRTVVDTDGVQLEDEAALRLEALEMVADLRKESPACAPLPSGQAPCASSEVQECARRCHQWYDHSEEGWRRRGYLDPKDDGRSVRHPRGPLRVA